jgi:catechol 2,3-dioxygenase-like lactoylglutathione lyase family enzyme
VTIDRLLDVTLAVPDPASLADFWERRGLCRAGDRLGTAERPRQLTLVEGPYRHLAELHLGCGSEADLAATAERLDALGVASRVTGTTLVCDDPVFDHRVVVDVTGPPPAVTAGPERAANRPGHPTRHTARADVVDEAAPRPPRRVGHVVLGTPRVGEACAFYLDGLGFRVSDRMLGDVLTFARVEPDHHNLLIQPAPVPYLNHYALEMDDVDAIGAAGTAVLAERPDAHVVGIGRHRLGSNLFWYLFDPAGNMFELFADMDQIADDDAWEREHRRDDWTPDEAGLSVWGPAEAPEVFFHPPDLAAIGAERESLGRR